MHAFDTPGIETSAQCPHCGERFPAFVDPSEERQVYTEDCHVCCRPIRFTVVCTDGEIASLETERE